MPIKRKASSFPPQYLRLLLHVADTGETVIVDNLGDNPGVYNSFRQQVNVFRARYREEAQTDIEKTISGKIDGVTLKLENTAPPYQVILEPSGTSFASAIDALLPEEEEIDLTPTEHEPEQESTSEAQDVLSSLYGEKK